MFFVWNSNCSDNTLITMVEYVLFGFTLLQSKPHYYYYEDDYVTIAPSHWFIHWKISNMILLLSASAVFAVSLSQFRSQCMQRRLTFQRQKTTETATATAMSFVQHVCIFLHRISNSFALLLFPLEITQLSTYQRSYIHLWFKLRYVPLLIR